MTPTLKDSIGVSGKFGGGGAQNSIIDIQSDHQLRVQKQNSHPWININDLVVSLFFVAF